MQKLTRAEEEVMQYLWKLKRCTVSNILDEIGKPAPPHSTISSIVRILESKGFVNHKVYGRTHEYFPVISKMEYSKRNLKELVKDYFGGSANKLVSFLLNEENLSLEDLDELIRQIKQKK
jgi:predicted transcriptional regulator